METISPSILILIIYSNNNPAYEIMHNIWKLYMNKYPEVKSYFLVNDSNIEENIIEKEDTIYCKFEETLMNITLKTIYGMNYLLDKYQNITHIIRTNISSFINIPTLINFIKTLPTINLYGGRPFYFNSNTKENKICFAQGSNIIFSKDVALYISNLIKSNKIKTDNIIDDVLFGKNLYKKYSIYPIKTYIINNKIPENFNEIIDKFQDIYHFRCKNNDNRYLDCQLQMDLLKSIYNITDFNIELNSKYIPIMVEMNNDNKKQTDKKQTNKKQTNKKQTNKKQTDKKQTNKKQTNKKQTNKKQTNKKQTNKKQTNKKQTNKKQTNKQKKIIIVRKLNK